MTIRKRGKSWQIIEMRNRKTFSITLDHKPTKKEARLLIDIKESESFKVKKTMLNAMREYLEIKKPPLLSYSTYVNYKTITEKFINDYKEFANKDIGKITQEDIQRVVTDLSSKLNPKTVRNIFSMIKVSYSMFLKWDFRITLPQRIKNETYTPNDKEVSMLLKYAQGTKFYIPICLALYSLRRSEILALTIDDIGDGEININKAKVRGVGKMYIKTTKTTASTRKIYVDKELTDLIKKQGYVYKGRVNSITGFIAKFCKDNGIKHCGLHALRHYYASKFSYLPISYIKKSGGWANTNTLLGIYTHSIQDYSKDVISEMAKLKPPCNA